MEQHSSNIHAGVPQAKPELREGMEIMAIESKNFDHYSIHKDDWYKVSVDESGTWVIRDDYKEHGDGILALLILKPDGANGIWGHLFDLDHPRSPESSEAKEAKPNEGWISVGDRLPEPEQHVLLFQDHGDNIDYWATKWTSDVSRFFTMNNVTHWQPLPSPPQSQTKA